LIIFKELRANSIVTKEREKILLKSMFSSLIDSMRHKYYKITRKIIMSMFKHFTAFTYKKELLIALFVGVPISIITGRGYKFFHIK